MCNEQRLQRNAICRAVFAVLPPAPRYSLEMRIIAVCVSVLTTRSKKNTHRVWVAIECYSLCSANDSISIHSILIAGNYFITEIVRCLSSCYVVVGKLELHSFPRSISTIFIEFVICAPVEKKTEIE